MSSLGSFGLQKIKQIESSMSVSHRGIILMEPIEKSFEFLNSSE